MNARRRFGLLVFVLAAAFAVLACTCSALGIGEEPTEAPPPTPLPTEPPASADTPEPEPTEPPEPEPTELPEPEPESGGGLLEILDVNGYLDNYDILNIAGVIQNNADVPINDIDIEVEIFDSADNSIYKETTFTDLYTIVPGQQTTFSLSVFDDLPDAARFEATVVDASETTVDFAMVESQNVTVTVDDDGDVHITGELVTTTGGPTTINGVAGAIFDEDDNLVTASSSSVAMGYVAPDQIGSFRVSMNGPASGLPEGGAWRVYIDAEPAFEAPSLNFTLSNVFDYRDGFDNLHVVGDVTNENASAVTVRLVAAIYDADGNVIDAASTDTPFFTISPGETIPYDLTGWDAINSTSELVGSRVTVQVDHAWTWDKDDTTVVLSTSGDTNVFDDFEGTFAGQVVNDSGGAVTGATIVVAFYDKETGEIRGTGYDWIFDEIPAGGTADYEVRIPISPGFDVSSASAVWYVKGDLP